MKFEFQIGAAKKSGNATYFVGNNCKLYYPNPDKPEKILKD